MQVYIARFILLALIKLESNHPVSTATHIHVLMHIQGNWYLLSNVNEVDEQMSSFYQYFRDCHRWTTFVFSIPRPIKTVRRQLTTSSNKDQVYELAIYSWAGL